MERALRANDRARDARASPTRAPALALAMTSLASPTSLEPRARRRDDAHSSCSPSHSTFRASERGNSPPLSTFASSALTAEEFFSRTKEASIARAEPRRGATPMSARASALVHGAMSALKASRARMETLVRTHRGEVLRFDDDDDEEDKEDKEEVTEGRVARERAVEEDEREARREATAMLMRRARETATLERERAKIGNHGAHREAMPSMRQIIERGGELVVLADSRGTSDALEGDDAFDDDGDDEVTSNASGACASVEVSSVEVKANAAAATSKRGGDVEASENLADAFARMMGKVITDTIREIESHGANVNAVVEPLSVVRAREVKEVKDVTEVLSAPATPRRGSRRKSAGSTAAPPPTPVTPSRRSKRLASKQTNVDAAEDD